MFTFVKQIKQAFIITFVETCKALTEATREHTAAIRAMHSTIEAVAKHTKYAADSQRRELQRRGQTHDF